MNAKEWLETGELKYKVRSVSDLIRHIGTRADGTANYSLFLGAGASVTSGIKTGSELIEIWLKELYERFKLGESPESIEQAREYFEKEEGSWYNPANPYSSLFEKRYDLASQRRRFVEEEVDSKVPSIGYAYLTALAEKNYFNAIFTTNFDDLLNEAFYQFSRTRPMLCAHDSSVQSVSLMSKRTKIIKLHGDYLFEDIKSTLRETESLEHNTKAKLVEFCKEYGLVFVGYSGHDRSVMDVLEYLVKQENYLKNGIYWCFRAGDEIPLSLRNLLWQEKVYPVLIDGFDEFFAQLHSELMDEPFNLESNFKRSKLQKSIKVILDDKFNLSQNSYIKNDLDAMRSNDYTKDISRFYGDITKSKEGELELPLSDVRNLLEVESVLSSGRHKEALEVCQEYYDGVRSDVAKPKYISTFIRIFREMGDLDRSSSWADRLIDIDVNNVSYYLEKARCIQSYGKRFEFLRNIVDRFQYKAELLNYLGRTALNLVENDPATDKIKRHEILEYLDKSLSVDPSLKNGAWKIKQDLILFYSDLEDDSSLEDSFNKLVEDAVERNPVHPRTLTLKVKKALKAESFKGRNEIVEELYDLYSKQSKFERKGTNVKIDDVVSSIFNVSDGVEHKEVMQKFYVDHLRDDDIDDDCELMLSKAAYFIGQEKDLEKARQYVDKAFLLKDADSYLAEFVSYAEIYDDFDVAEIEALLESNRTSYTDIYYWKMKSEISVQKKEYGEAFSHIEKSFDAGLPLDDYLTGVSFILLGDKKYDDALKLYKKYKSHKSDVFKVNCLFAAKKAESKDYNEVELRNLTAKGSSESVKLCAFAVLGNVRPAKSIYEKQVALSYKNYYMFRCWHILQELLSDVVDKEQRAA